MNVASMSFSSTEFELQGDQLVCYALLFLSI